MGINTYEKKFAFIKEIVLSIVDCLETYIVSDAYARFSIYVVEALDDNILNLLKEKLTNSCERIESIEKDGFIYQDLNHPDYELPILISERDHQKVYFVDRHINLLNWSLRNNRFVSKAPITCFYSFKGGLGRTTALVLTAMVLARQGKKVALMDFDLEAPGLAHVFSPEFEDLHKFRGILDYIVDLSSLNDTSLLDLDDYYYAINKQDIVGNNGGELFVFTAGLSSEEENLYMSKFSKLNSIFHSGSNFLIDNFLQEVESKIAPDVILIDTRTGLNDWGGLFLSRYAKNAFLFFYGTPQNMFGLETLLPNLKSNKDLNFYLVNSPVPQLEELAKQEIGYYLDRSYELFGRYFYEEGNYPFIEDKTSPHYPIEIPFDDLAVLLNSTEKLKRLVEKQNGDSPYVKLASLIQTDIKKEDNFIETPLSQSNGTKKQLLEVFSKIAPASAAAEYEFEDINQLKRNFYPRKDYRFIFDKTKYLILGEKGVGKTALYAVLNVPEYAKELAEYCEINSGEIKGTEWIKGLDEKGQEFPQPSIFNEIGKQSAEQHRIFWKRLLLVQANNEKTDSWNEFAQENKNLKESDIDEKIIQLDNKLSAENRFVVMVYDYLDKQITETDGIRGKLISALLDVWRDIHNRYSHLRCKIFLRKDIFDREVELTDKVKISNHTATIKWEYDQLLNVVWKRAWEGAIEDKYSSLDEWFKEQVKNWNDLGADMGLLPQAEENENRKLLSTLVGEFMGGSKKAFPYNWILYHISDTKRNIHPRSLLNLFSEAAKQQLEKADFQGDNYVIPKYLELATKLVSERRVDDVKEEYPSLKPVFNKLRDIIERMPIEENTLKEALKKLIEENNMKTTDSQLIAQLENVGVLYEYKFNRRGAEKKYHIPDLYLIGMGLQRRGPGAHKAIFGKK
jgi:CobQ/CobB/MinD/ParA nucleotide binding domain